MDASLRLLGESEELLARVSAHSSTIAPEPSGSPKALHDRCEQLELELRSVELEAAKLHEINEQVSRFAYTAAHDLQEPLRKITAFSGLLDEAINASDSAEIQRVGKVIGKSAAGARALIEDILSYSRIVHGGHKTELLDLREQVQIVLDRLLESVAETGAKIELFSSSIRFMADRSQFGQLLQDILSNAIKYRKQGEAPVINISASRADNRILLSIADNGIGFEQSFAEEIFEPFTRLHNSYKYPGSGIGLAICKSICERHGWDISLQSEPGQGTTFFLTIPAVAEHPRPMPFLKSPPP